MVSNPGTIVIINNWRLCVIASRCSAGDVQSSVVVCTCRMIRWHRTGNTRNRSVQCSLICRKMPVCNKLRCNQLYGYYMYQQTRHWNSYILPTDIYTYLMIPTRKCGISFLHGINGLGFVMDTDFVYCAVRAESLIVKMYHIHIMPWIRWLVGLARVLTQVR